MEIAGLPIHPLVVHATVVFVPLSAAFTILFAVLPRWRWLTRWPTAALAVAALALAWISTQSGKALVEARPELGRLVEVHQERGELLANVMIAFALLVVLACWSLAGTSALASGRGAQDSRLPALEKVLPALLVLAALGVMVLITLVGDSGARAVWG